jgi:hypothetical protein
METDTQRTQSVMRAELLAPCGMNCAVCSAYLAYHLPERQGKPKCAGCRPRGKMCAYIKKSCEHLRKNEYTFCYECATFPCERLSKIDKRYRLRYHTSFIDNLKEIQTRGIAAFLKVERKRHLCPNCGGVVCIHNGRCYEGNPPEVERNP